MRTAGLCVIALLWCVRLPAPLLPGPDLAKRIEAADTIVVARVTGGTTVVAGNQASSELALRVDRVLKGDLTPGSEIGAHLEGRLYFGAAAGSSQVTAGLFGIWFLRSEPHRWEVVSQSGELYFAPVILPEETPAGMRAASPEGTVANEMASAMRWMSDHAPPAGQLRKLSEDFRSLSPATTHPLYREFAGAKSASLRAVGIEGLISGGDPEGVKLAAANWTDLAEHADVNPVINSLMVYANNADAAAVRALGELALRDPAEPRLRENAVYALRAIHTKEALPALVALLDDKEDRVRPYALSGICLFVRNAPAVAPESAPSMVFLQTREPRPWFNAETERYCMIGAVAGPGRSLDEYVSFWKSWWSEHRAELEEASR